MATTNPFESSAFKKGLTDIQTRVNNSNTTTQRMGLGDTSTAPVTSKLTNNAVNNVSQSDQQSYANYNQGLANNPAFKQSVSNNNRDFTEDKRRFDAGLGVKANEQSTIRYQSDNQLSGDKYGADAGVKSTQIGADASVKSTGLNADATKYSADRGVDMARIGADANRFSALLGAGTATLNSQQYRPTFNR